MHQKKSWHIQILPCQGLIMSAKYIYLPHTMTAPETQICISSCTRSSTHSLSFFVFLTFFKYTIFYNVHIKPCFTYFQTHFTLTLVIATAPPLILSSSHALFPYVCFFFFSLSIKSLRAFPHLFPVFGFISWKSPALIPSLPLLKWLYPSSICSPSSSFPSHIFNLSALELLDDISGTGKGYIIFCQPLPRLPVFFRFLLLTRSFRVARPCHLYGHKPISRGHQSSKMRKVPCV